MVAHKRVEQVLDVAERMAAGADRGDRARSLSAPMAAAVVERGLADVVRLHDYLPEAEKQATVARSVLHLSTSLGEGWGLCVLEAAQLGVPTVAYDVDGLRDSVRDGETGWLVRSGERIEDVVERALAELADPRRRAEIGAACRAWAAEFDWDWSATRMATLISASVRTGTFRAGTAPGPGSFRWGGGRRAGAGSAAQAGMPRCCGPPRLRSACSGGPHDRGAGAGRQEYPPARAGGGRTGAGAGAGCSLSPCCSWSSRS